MKSPSVFSAREACAWALLACFARVLLACVVAERVPPAVDGTYYHIVATRIAEGAGYSWLWPDGVVTYATHFPVGYPALLGLGYWLGGATPLVGMLWQALFAGLATYCTYELAWDLARHHFPQQSPRRAARSAALVVAFLPTLLAYSVALMTEALVGMVLVLAVWVGRKLQQKSQGKGRAVLWFLCAGLLCFSTLLRPQSILFAPVLSFFFLSGNLGRRTCGALLFSFVVLLGCLPWTARNCARMDQCAFVSANGGWNLLIGTFPEGRGAWVPLEGERVPPACREVFQEVAKDSCFGEAARQRIAAEPLAWLSLIPAKLRVTFDHTASAAEYWAAAGALAPRGKYVFGAIEIGTQRLEFLLALLGLASLSRSKRKTRGEWAVIAGIALGFLGVSAAAAWCGLLVYALLYVRPSALVLRFALCALLLTALLHAVFFGAGRYSMPLLLLFAPLAGLGWSSLSRTFDRQQQPDDN